jgi:predicted ATPase
VTLTGPGGIGKTAFALWVGRRILSEFEDGAWPVELASLTDPDLVPSAVAQVLGLKLAGEAISAEAIARSIDDQSLLLVLDNCEHLIDATATLVGRQPLPAHYNSGYEPRVSPHGGGVSQFYKPAIAGRVYC